MKKTLIILALALFLGGIGAPAIAANYSNFSQIELREDEPKKKEKKSEKKTESTEQKSGDCSSSCGGEKKSSDCTKK
jgi:hypothetical protein